MTKTRETRYPQVWERQEEWGAIHEFAGGYKKFLDTCKTEREGAREILRAAQAAGFEDLDGRYAEGRGLEAGDRLCALRQGKAAALFIVGERPLREGMRLVCAHLDAPRLDVRPNPFYEKEDFALMKTHYYGGIKKYQWATVPLALHGVIVKKGGERIWVSMGEAEGEPVFYISDLPKHLSAEQAKKTLGEGIGGEDLNIICGSVSLPAEEEASARQYALRLLSRKYGIEEKDFVSAELELVPAGKARDAGLDGSLIAAYGHDDRICAYAALQALLGIQKPEYTAGVLFVDKEEVGSQGGSGMNSRLMENLTARLAVLSKDPDPLTLKLALERSLMISADVTVGLDPNYPECYEAGNTARLGRGPALTKYAGHLGKKGCNDASAEYLALLRDVFDDAGVYWQTGEFGRIDLGGGGTIAPFAAAYGMQVVDCGVALLSMHAPCELASKADVYEACRAYRAFMKSGADLSRYYG